MQDGRNDKGQFAEGNQIACENRIYKDIDELQAKINEYFDNCPDRPTLNGLGLFLGLCGRQGLWDYMSYEEPFSSVIKKAMSRIESKFEDNLYNQACAGSIFWLKNRGWSDKPELNSLTDNALSDLIAQIKPSKGVLPKDEKDNGS